MLRLRTRCCPGSRGQRAAPTQPVVLSFSGWGHSSGPGPPLPPCTSACFLSRHALAVTLGPGLLDGRTKAL